MPNDDDETIWMPRWRCRWVHEWLNVHKMMKKKEGEDLNYDSEKNKVNQLMKDEEKTSKDQANKTNTHSELKRRNQRQHENAPRPPFKERWEMGDLMLSQSNQHYSSEWSRPSTACLITRPIPLYFFLIFVVWFDLLNNTSLSERPNHVTVFSDGSVLQQQEALDIRLYAWFICLFTLDDRQAPYLVTRYWFRRSFINKTHSPARRSSPS